MVTVGVLALQGAFLEHLVLLRRAAAALVSSGRYGDAGIQLDLVEVRTPAELSCCAALVVPGGESTTLALVAERSGLLEPLREFVKVLRKPTWGTCAGMILLAEAADATKKGGQALVGGLDVRVRRNHFGRQINSFEADLHLPFLAEGAPAEDGTLEAVAPFRGIFIRAPVVDRLLPPHHDGGSVLVAPPSGRPAEDRVRVLGRLPRRDGTEDGTEREDGEGAIVAVQQGNVLGTSFHPELTDDMRIHVWWLRQVVEACV